MEERKLTIHNFMIMTHWCKGSFHFSTGPRVSRILGSLSPVFISKIKFVLQVTQARWESSLHCIVCSIVPRFAFQLLAFDQPITYPSAMVFACTLFAKKKRIYMRIWQNKLKIGYCAKGKLQGIMFMAIGKLEHRRASKSLWKPQKAEKRTDVSDIQHWNLAFFDSCFSYLVDK